MYSGRPLDSWGDPAPGATLGRRAGVSPLHPTDIGLRALSPAINGATTAVRAPDEVEGVLRTAATLRLGPARIPAGAGSAVVPAPSWSDIVDLTVWDVLAAGEASPQVTRRSAGCSTTCSTTSRRIGTLRACTTAIS